MAATIAEILMAQGQHAAESRRARGQAWQPFLQYAANLPRQIMADRQAEQDRSIALADAQQARDLRGLQMERTGQELEAGRRELDAGALEADQRKRFAELVSDASLYSEDGLFDKPKALALARSKGWTDLAPALDEYNRAHDKSVWDQRNVQSQIAERERPKLEQVDPTKDLYRGNELVRSGVVEDKPLTFGALHPVLMNGRRVLVRERSDGAVVDIKGNIVTEAQPDVPPQTSRGVPQYVFAVDPQTGESRRMTEEEAVRIGATQPQGSGGLGGAAVQLRNSRAAAALNSIERLKQLAPVRSPGPAGIAQGVGEVAKGYLGYSTKTRQFQALIQPTAMQMVAAIQGAANLSDNERKAMAEMLGSINTMDYESQMALLQHAADLVSSGADVEQVEGKWLPVTRAFKVAPGARVPGGGNTGDTDALLDELLRPPNGP